MIPAYGSYRIPRVESASRNAEAARYLRFEYRSASLAWLLHARPQTPGLATRFTKGILAAFGALRRPTAEAPAASAPLRTGVAAVHFTGEPAHAHPLTSRQHPHPAWDTRPAGGLLPPVLAVDPAHEPCECHP